MSTQNEKPILMSAPMVRAILDGRKTMTRRVIKPQPTECGLDWVTACGGDFSAWQDAGLTLDEHSEAGGPCQRVCPYGRPGDRLWVRECFAKTGAGFVYKSDNKIDQPYWSILRWRPSIHMPHRASRITLEIVSVRVERVQEITEDDAKVEGGPRGYELYQSQNRDCREWFRKLWDSISAKRGYGWGKNPFVWVIEFRISKAEG